MATLTKFTLSPTGELVYKKTGRLAPSDYIFRKNTVYKIGKDGVRRRVGSLSRKLTKTEASKIAKAEKSRTQRSRTQRSRPSPEKPPKPSKGTIRIAQTKTLFAEYGEGDWDDDFESTDFPVPTQEIKEEFAQRVRDAALSVAPESLKLKIQALSTEALWEAYQQNEYIFERYFYYHDPFTAPYKTTVSVWLYQFVYRIQQYMGVSS